MKSTVLFFITISFICFVNNQIVFDQVKSLLTEFRVSIEREQVDSTARCKKEDLWMVGEIAKARARVDLAKHNVALARALIAKLEGEIKETRKQIRIRRQKIRQNNELLKKFKKERCANNLLFVKSLREHIEGIEVLTLLRVDIQGYFKTGKVPVVALFEKFSEFEHLLDDEHKLVLSQLKTKITKLGDHAAALHKTTDSYTGQRQRTAAAIGRGHVDNTRAELKALATPNGKLLLTTKLS
jgi:hypothetical protein